MSHLFAPITGNPTVELWTLSTVALLLIPSIITDIRIYKLPNAWLLGAWIGGIIAQICCVLFLVIPWTGIALVWLWAILRMLSVILCLFLFRKLTKGSFGMGDVKLAALCAFFLNILPWFVMMILGCIVALLGFVILWLVRKLTGVSESVRTVRIPFGPFLFVGFCISSTFNILT